LGAGGLGQDGWSLSAVSHIGHGILLPNSFAGFSCPDDSEVKTVRVNPNPEYTSPVSLERLQPLLTRQQILQQSGFTRNRSTIDAILAMRLLAELHREFQKPLHVTYIDIKAAFDSVDRKALWKALHATGAPQFLIQLIQDLHTGTTSRVRVGKKLLKAFNTSSGVRQRCVLAPALFCLAVDWTCPDVPAVSALLSVKQCSQTSTK